MTDDIRDQPRSWPAIVRDAVGARWHVVWLVPFLFNAAVGALAVATVLHINGVAVPAFAAAEAATGSALAESTSRWQLFLYAVGIPLGAVASLYKYLEGR